jgi:hypothetical protein
MSIDELPPLHLTTIKAILNRYPGREGDTVVKFLLTMRLNGYSSGTYFSEADAVKACEGILGRKGVRAAIAKLIKFCPLASMLEDEFYLPASRLPQCADSPTPPNTSMDTGLQGGKIQKRGPGRPATYYAMPTEAMLAAGLGVELPVQIEITLDELKTRILTELLMEKLIQRHPSKADYAALGVELGKGASTIRRYAAANRSLKTAGDRTTAEKSRGRRRHR